MPIIPGTTVTLSYYSELGTQPSSVGVPGDAIITAELLPSMEDAGWTFTGWYWESTLTTQVVVGDHLYGVDTTFYAGWIASGFAVDLDDFSTFNNLSTGNYSVVSRAKSSSAVTSTDSVGVAYQKGIYSLFTTSDSKDLITSDSKDFEVLNVSPTDQVDDQDVTVTVLDIRKYEQLGQDTETARLNAIANNDVLTYTLAQFVNYSLPAEMYPTSYIGEALKAQDVAIRTYFFDRAKSADMRRLHGGAMICNSADHCLVVYHASEYNNLPVTTRNMCEAARSATDGEVLTYNGDIIDAAFHSCAYKKTVSHQDYYDTSYSTPYLTSVTTYPYDENGYTPEGSVPNDSYYPVSNYSFNYLGSEGMLHKLYRSSSSESYNDMLIRLFGSSGAADIQANGIKCATLSNYQRFAYNYYNVYYRLDYINLWGRGNIPGRTVRSKLGLRSSSVDFQESSDGTSLSITAYGSGHGVGMSQQGAKTMSRYLNKTYKDILEHYYNRSSVTHLTQGMLPT